MVSKGCLQGKIRSSVPEKTGVGFFPGRDPWNQPTPTSRPSEIRETPLGTPMIFSTGLFELLDWSLVNGSLEIVECFFGNC